MHHVSICHTSVSSAILGRWRPVGCPLEDCRLCGHPVLESKVGSRPCSEVILDEHLGRHPGTHAVPNAPSNGAQETYGRVCHDGVFSDADSVKHAVCCKGAISFGIDVGLLGRSPASAMARLPLTIWFRSRRTQRDSRLCHASATHVVISVLPLLSRLLFTHQGVNDSLESSSRRQKGDRRSPFVLSTPTNLIAPSTKSQHTHTKPSRSLHWLQALHA